MKEETLREANQPDVRMLERPLKESFQCKHDTSGLMLEAQGSSHFMCNGSFVRIQRLWEFNVPFRSCAIQALGQGSKLVFEAAAQLFFSFSFVIPLLFHIALIKANLLCHHGERLTMKSCLNAGH